MLKLKTIAAIGILAAAASASALAGTTGNGAPSGAHYNLNIIGVAKDKTADMTGSERHTIFVALGKDNASVQSNIYLTEGEFQVCDGNAFDEATDCAGNPVGTQKGAVFQLPCNTNLSSTSVDVIACPEGEGVAYEVWARALGKPGGSATITTCVDDPASSDPSDLICSTENVVLVRNTGKSTFKDVTNELTSLVTQLDADPKLERVALFQGDFEDWVWQYDNKGLRLAQLRFYLLPQ